ncbi:unnamed protein product [Toxocara canis]|uniref:Transposase n=1 Tax=Toxocara canis TaxID=6265 RepID=A0A183U7F2_TOXCA|nr:unnamed protein product [Toxocara canis]
MRLGYQSQDSSRRLMDKLPNISFTVYRLRPRGRRDGTPETAAFLQDGLGINRRLNNLARSTVAYARPAETSVVAGRHFRRKGAQVEGDTAARDGARRLDLQERIRRYHQSLRQADAESAALEAGATRAVPTAIPKQHWAALQARVPTAGADADETERLAKQQRELSQVASEQEQRESTVPAGTALTVMATLQPNAVPGQTSEKPHREGGSVS